MKAFTVTGIIILFCEECKLFKKIGLNIQSQKTKFSFTMKYLSDVYLLTVFRTFNGVMSRNSTQCYSKILK